MKIPSIFYGKPGQVSSRMRKLAKSLVQTRSFATYEPGPLLDTKEVRGLVLFSQEFERSSEQQFHCYVLSDCLSEAAPRGEMHAVIREWLMASLSDEWRFLCTLGGSSVLGLDKADSFSARRYLEAACHHWPAMALERRRFGPVLQGDDVLDHWSTLFVAVRNLGVSVHERMAMTNREPEAYLKLIDSREGGRE